MFRRSSEILKSSAKTMRLRKCREGIKKKKKKKNETKDSKVDRCKSVYANPSLTIYANILLKLLKSSVGLDDLHDT